MVITIVRPCYADFETIVSSSEENLPVHEFSFDKRLE